MFAVRSVVLAVLFLSAVASAQHWVSDVPGNFIDLSTTGGTMLTGIGDDSENNIVTTIGNAMFPAGNLRIGNNGAVANFGAVVGSNDISFSNSPLGTGSTAVPAGLPVGTIAALAPYWDDMDVVSGTGGTEIWWQELNGMLAIMWKNESHYPNTAGSVVTFEVLVYGSPANPCDPRVQFLYPRSAFGGAQAANDDAVSATIGYVAGTLGGGLVNAEWSYNAASVSAGTVLSLVDGPTVPFGAVITSPGGPGTAQVDIRGSQFSCGGGYYFLPVSFTHSGPSWFYGLAISFNDLVAEYSSGFPHVGPVGTTIGPVAGIPSGLTFWGVTVGWPAGAAPAVYVAGPAFSYTVP